MSKLTEQLAVLMQADSVPMSDAWGKLYDELKRIDEARAKPIGEVVAWGENIPPRQGIDRKVDFRWLNFDVKPGTKLYAHPPARTEQQPEQDSKPKTVPVAVAWSTDDRETDQSATTYDMEVAGRWLEKGWKVTPLFEFVQEPPKKQGLRAGINKIREHFGFNLHSHQREAMRHFPIPPHLLDTTFHVDPKVMLKAQKGIDTSTDLFVAARRQYMDALDMEVREAIQERKPATAAEARAIYDEVNRQFQERTLMRGLTQTPYHLLSNVTPVNDDFRIDRNAILSTLKGVRKNADFYYAYQPEYANQLNRQIARALEERQPATTEAALAIYEEFHKKHHETYQRDKLTGDNRGEVAHG